MNIVNLVGTFFRLVSIIMGIILAFLVYDIYRRTKGGSKGWLNLAICFISLASWAVSQVIFLFIINNFLMRVISGIILFFTIATTGFLAPSNFIHDMKLSKLKWLTRRNAYIFVFLVLGLFLLYNFILTSPQNFWSELLNINLSLVYVFFLFGSYEFYTIYKQLKVKLWLYLAIGYLFTSLGVSLVAVNFTDCCGEGSPLYGKEVCSTWMYDYVSVLPTSCIESLIPLSSNGTGFIVIAEIILIFVFHRMRKIFS